LPGSCAGSGPSSEDLIPLEPFPPRGGPVQDPVLTPRVLRARGWVARRPRGTHDGVDPSSLGSTPSSEALGCRCSRLSRPLFARKRFLERGVGLLGVLEPHNLASLSALRAQILTVLTTELHRPLLARQRPLEGGVGLLGTLEVLRPLLHRRECQEPAVQFSI